MSVKAADIFTAVRKDWFLDGKVTSAHWNELLTSERHLTFLGHPEGNEKSGGECRLIKMIDNMIYQCAKVDM